MTKRLVLDANAFRGLRDGEIGHLAEQGFVFVVSETALNETWAHCAVGYARGELTRKKARGLFFGRAKKFRPYVDPEYPVAVAGAYAVERIAMAAGGVFNPSCKSGERATKLRAQWEQLMHAEFSDEEWLERGQVRYRALANLDDVVLVGQRPKAVWSNVPRSCRESSDWNTISEQEKTERRRQYARKCFPEAVAERLDAFICVTAWRLNEAEHGHGSAKKHNDGPDLAVTMHVGDGFILLTGDNRLITTVDASGTYQAPWVRRPNDLDNLPEGPAWGESARRQAASFKRRTQSL